MSLTSITRLRFLTCHSSTCLKHGSLKQFRNIILSSRLSSAFSTSPNSSDSDSSDSSGSDSDSERYSKSNISGHYDVIITGGGMVGSSMAASLGHSPAMQDKQILLLEGGTRKEFHGPPEKFSVRTCALNTSSQQLLSSIGAWEEILSHRSAPVKRMQVWDSLSDAMISFPPEGDDMTEDLATIVENDIIQATITNSLARTSNVDIEYSARVDKYQLPQQVQLRPMENEVQDDLAYVSLEDGRTFSTHLMIGADGANSLLRKTARIDTMAWEYGQMGVCATVEFTEPTINNVAWQRFLRTGPIAFLPLDDTHSCMIWSTSTSDAKNLLKLEHDSFVDAINHAVWNEDSKEPLTQYLGNVLDNVLTTVGCEGTSSRQLPPTIRSVDQESKAAFPLGLCHAQHYVKKRMALIGDAAHRIHPLAGQGVNLGFSDVVSLRDHLTHAVLSGADIGFLPHLLDYETERQRHVVPIMMAVDGLAKLYGTDFMPVVLLRSLGLQAVNGISPLKQLFTDFARN